MPRYRLTIAYDGTDFCGWQKQEPPTAPASIAAIAPLESGDEFGGAVGVMPGRGDSAEAISHLLASMKGRPLGRILTKLGKATRERVHEALAVQKTRKLPLGQLMVELGYCTQRDIDESLAAQAGNPLPGTTINTADVLNVLSRPGNPPIAAYSADTPQIPSIREGRVALRTVQGVVEQAVREIVREPIELLGASRTDSGVHARGQVAAFTCEPRDPATPFQGTGWPFDRGTDRLMAALNSRLPDDVQITAAAVADNDFDPIGGCTSKGYSYTYHIGLERPLWDRRYVTHIRWPRTVDLAAMNAAAAVLVGEHDFAAFAAAGHGRLTTIRTVYSLCVVDQGAGRYRLEISGNGFLWNMVRIVAGTLLQVGIGQRSVDDVRTALESCDRAKAGSTLGPEGLCLEWIKYGDEASP